MGKVSRKRRSKNISPSDLEKAHQWNTLEVGRIMSSGRSKSRAVWDGGISTNQRSAFEAARKSVFNEMSEVERQRFDVANSTASESAKKALKKEVYLFIGNLSFRARAQNVVNVLSSIINEKMPEYAHFMDEPVLLHCQIGRSRHDESQSGGWAVVTLTSRVAADHILKASNGDPGIVILGRQVRVRESNSPPRRGPRRKLDHSVTSFDLASVTVGHLIPGTSARDMDINPQWSVPEPKTLELNGFEHRQLALTFGNYRLEFSAKQIKKLTVAHPVLEDDESDPKCTLRILFRKPPNCFRKSTNEVNVILSRILAQNLDLFAGLKSDGFIWEHTLEHQNNDEDVWQRTTDPSDKLVLGRCLHYEFNIKKTAADVEQALKKFSLRPGACVLKDSVMSVPLSPSVGSSEDWTGGFDDVFANLSFDLNYLLHGLISSHKLVLQDREAAMRLVKTIHADTSPQRFRSAVALEDFFFTPYSPQIDTVQLLISRLKEYASKEELPLTNGTTNEEEEEDGAVGGAEKEEVFLTRRVLVTPLRICPQHPEPEMANRILRVFSKHRHRFVRVVFVDEGYSGVYKCIQSNDIVKRIEGLMHHGMYIAGRKFVFLAFSNSQLREQSCWFYDEDSRGDDVEPAPSAEEIRASVGDLSGISVVGKRAARMGQAFSSTMSTVEVVASEVRTIPDIERNDFCFSDGVGVISQELAMKVSESLELLTTPSAYQIRYRGCKGVVSVCPDQVKSMLLPPRIQMALRPSMKKFEGNEQHNRLEICRTSSFSPCYLNRQIISVLSSLGVEDDVILDLLNRMLSRIQGALTDSQLAASVLQEHGASGSTALQMINAGFDVCVDRHLKDLLYSLCDRLLLDLQLRARILVPKGVLLLGIMDETNSLEEDCIYFKSSGHHQRDVPGVGTRVVVGRSPCLHPGDIRVLKVAEPPALSHLVDVVVFSSRGQRPQPNMMAGGDLDGDIYFVIWDERLVFSQPFPPMEYVAPRQEPAPLGGSRNYPSTPSGVHDIIDFFIKYMQNDNLGRIANAHVAHADISEDGVRSPVCLQLAELHSTAVDYAKTGVPAVFPRELVPKSYPSFMENPSKTSYESTKLLGRIYELSKHKNFIPSSRCFKTEDMEVMLANGYDPRLVIKGHEEYLEDAETVYYNYCWDLWNISCQFEVWNEGELISGFARSLSRKIDRRREKPSEGSMARLVIAVQDLRQKYVDEFYRAFKVMSQQESSGMHSEVYRRALCKASAWYHVAYTYDDDSEYLPYLSFAWLPIKDVCRLRQTVYWKRAALAK